MRPRRAIGSRPANAEAAASRGGVRLTVVPPGTITVSTPIGRPWAWPLGIGLVLAGFLGAFGGPFELAGTKDAAGVGAFEVVRRDIRFLRHVEARHPLGPGATTRLEARPTGPGHAYLWVRPAAGAAWFQPYSCISDPALLGPARGAIEAFLAAPGPAAVVVPVEPTDDDGVLAIAVGAVGAAFALALGLFLIFRDQAVAFDRNRRVITWRRHLRTRRRDLFFDEIACLEVAPRFTQSPRYGPLHGGTSVALLTRDGERAPLGDFPAGPSGTAGANALVTRLASETGLPVCDTRAGAAPETWDAQVIPARVRGDTHLVERPEELRLGRVRPADVLVGTAALTMFVLPILSGAAAVLLNRLGGPVVFGAFGVSGLVAAALIAWWLWSALDTRVVVFDLRTAEVSYRAGAFGPRRRAGFDQVLTLEAGPEGEAGGRGQLALRLIGGRRIVLAIFPSGADRAARQDWLATRISEVTGIPIRAASPDP